MKTTILIKDIIYFGAIAEAYHMDSCKTNWSWVFACDCKGSMASSFPHTYEECEHKDNLFWSERYKEEGRTVHMPLREDEVTEVTCSFEVKNEDADKLRCLVRDAEDLLGETGMEYYDIFTAKIKAEEGVEILSVLEEHQFYTQTKDWYLRNDINPITFEEIKVNVVSKYIAERLLHQFGYISRADVATISATWFPSMSEDQRLLFEEHVCKIEEGGHVTSEPEAIKAKIE